MAFYVGARLRVRVRPNDVPTIDDRDARKREPNLTGKTAEELAGTASALARDANCVRTIDLSFAASSVPTQSGSAFGFEQCCRAQ